MKRPYNLLLRVLFLLLATIAAACTLNNLRSDRLPWHGDWDKHVENRARQTGVPLIGLHTVRQALMIPSTRLLDARPTADFRAGHIPRATSLPIDHAEELIAAMQIDLQREQPIVTYCARNDCAEGLELALFLRRIGFTNVTLFAGGLTEWRAGGEAVEVEP
jgi:rhodanese-related sulfurtransferase